MSDPRILNADRLLSHGNLRGRHAVFEILEAGLQAADPYNEAAHMVRLEAGPEHGRGGGNLVVGGPDYEPAHSPVSGPAVFPLDTLGRVFVFGAGKGVQRVARALEDVLGDRLTGGHVIAKHGDPLILERVGVTYGAHPVPDEGCVRGCRRIVEMCRGLQPNDLVFTISANGISSLLTLPVPGVSLEDVRRTTYLLQIDRGTPTGDLNAIRNHLDVLKGGRISRYIRPARACHLVVYDPQEWDQYMYHNRWLHPLPDCTTFADAVAMLHKWRAWDEAPESVRRYLERANPAEETVKADEFLATGARIFATLPKRSLPVPTAMRKAAELGFAPHKLAGRLCIEAGQAGRAVAAIANTIEREGVPFEPPCAIFTGGELVVTVGEETGIGGRNQEYALWSALDIAGSKNIVIGAADTDGTDGPGRQFHAADDELPCLAGGIVDGQTVEEAKAHGVDIRRELTRHNTSPALWKLDSGIAATQNISMNDVGVALILGRHEGPLFY